MTAKKFHSADGAAQRFNDNTAPGHVLYRANFTVKVGINVTKYADAYGETVEDADPITHVHDLLIEALPVGLRNLAYVEVREDERTGPMTIVAEHNK